MWLFWMVNKTSKKGQDPPCVFLFLSLFVGDQAMPIYLSIYLSIYQSIYLSIYQSIYLYGFHVVRVGSIEQDTTTLENQVKARSRVASHGWLPLRVRLNLHRPEISPTSYSVLTLQKSFGRGCKPRSLECIHLRKDPHMSAH